MSDTRKILSWILLTFTAIFGLVSIVSINRSAGVIAKANGDYKQALAQPTFTHSPDDDEERLARDQAKAEQPQEDANDKAIRFEEAAQDDDRQPADEE